MRVDSDTPSRSSKIAERLGMRPVMSRIDDFSALTGIGRTKLYELIGSGELKAVMVAGRRLIPTSEADRLLAEALKATSAQQEVA